MDSKPLFDDIYAITKDAIDLVTTRDELEEFDTMYFNLNKKEIQTISHSRRRVMSYYKDKDVILEELFNKIREIMKQSNCKHPETIFALAVNIKAKTFTVLEVTKTEHK